MSDVTQAKRGWITFIVATMKPLIDEVPGLITYFFSFTARLCL